MMLHGWQRIHLTVNDQKNINVHSSTIPMITFIRCNIRFFLKKTTCAKDTGEENEIMLMESIHVYRFNRQKFPFFGRFKIMEEQKLTCYIDFFQTVEDLLNLL